MPFAFASFYGKVSRLDQKLELAPDTAILVRERVKGVNHCLWCMGAGRWYVINKTPQNLPKLNALHEYRASPLFSDKERAALDFAGELTETKHVAPGTFAQLARHYSEREICEIVMLVASEYFYNITNHGLNIGSDGLCELSVRPRSAGAT